ncbi:hypothetical protein [Roseiconus lacunae]|uniref:hypothetical protein n=1 Tax=Roseiconus lacunae TaxID=2605694 RepID=UPI001E59C62F|nr:hypothetical protein [Roseiconus lacunae]MCD0461922.1 hypothetical protein [Roseiconus lacunae]
MKVIPLNCNHCGAPLEVAANARFVTCGFCDARLSIQHIGNSYSTEVLEDLRATTDQIARDIKEIKSSTAIERLDKQWEHQRFNHMVTDKHGGQHLPSKGGAVFGGGLIVAFGLFWTIMAFGITSAGRMSGAPGVIGIFPVFGLIFIAAGVFNMFRIVKKADAYQHEQSNYLRERRRLLEQSERERSSS